MRNFFAAIAAGTQAILLVGAGSAATPPAASFQVVGRAPIAGEVRWDYLSFDASSGRLFVAHADHVDVVDPASAAILGRLEGTEGVRLVAEFARSGDTEVREAAIRALGGSRRADAVEWLTA